MSSDSPFTLHEVVFFPGSGFKVNHFGYATAHPCNSYYTNLCDSSIMLETREGTVVPWSKAGANFYACFAFGEEDIVRAKEAILGFMREKSQGLIAKKREADAAYDMVRRDIELAASQVETAKLENS